MISGAVLQYAEVRILTDQKSLVQLSEQRLHTPWKQKVFIKLVGLQYKIIYRKGVDNSAADALSRMLALSCSAVSVAQQKCLTEVAASYESDAHAQQLIAKLVIDPSAVPHFFRDGLLRYNQRVWIGHNPELQTRIIAALHDSAIGGHSGIPVTYRRIKQLFAWTGLKSAVQEFVRSCLTCQQAKPDRSHLPGLLQPLPGPDRTWHGLCRWSSFVGWL